MSQRPKLKPRKELELLLFPSRNILGSLSEQKAHLKPWRFAQPWFPAPTLSRKVHTLCDRQPKFVDLDQGGQVQLAAGALQAETPVQLAQR